MVRPRKLSDAEILWVIGVYAAHRALPTVTEMSQKLGVSRQLISQIGSGAIYTELYDTVSGFNGAQSMTNPRRSL